MAVPGFQDFMLPLLQFVETQRVVTPSECYAAMADLFQLTPEQRDELLPSGRQALYKNRIAWATTHMVKAGLADRPARGQLRITDRGRQVLREKPHRIDLSYLSQFPEHEEFRKATTTPSSVTKHHIDPDADTKPDDLSPTEMLDKSYQRLRKSLAQDLLDRIKAAPPAFFEQLVVDLLVSMGYGGSHEDAGQAIGRSGDGGIDGIIKEDRLGLDFVYIQAKRWEGVVGRPQIQGFAGSLEGQRARKGVFITTSQFSSGARDYVSRIEKRIVLVDGEELAELMLDYDIGVSEVASYKVQRVDLDYFDEE